MRIAVSSDHAGFTLKEAVKAFLTAEHREVLDLSALSTDPLDYFDYTAMGQALRQHRAERGILLCASGVGALIAANGIPGIRARAGAAASCRKRRPGREVLSRIRSLAMENSCTRHFLDGRCARIDVPEGTCPHHRYYPYIRARIRYASKEFRQNCHSSGTAYFDVAEIELPLFLAAGMIYLGWSQWRAGEHAGRTLLVEGLAKARDIGFCSYGPHKGILPFLIQDRVRRYDSVDITGEFSVRRCKHLEYLTLFFVECTLADGQAVFGIGAKLIQVQVLHGLRFRSRIEARKIARACGEASVVP